MIAREIGLRPRIDPEDRIAPALRLRHAGRSGIDRGLLPGRDVPVFDRLSDRRDKSEAEEDENLTD